MTKEEAIKILKEIEYPANGDNWEYREMAFDMAIKALSVEPCEDAISRQAAMDFIRGLTRWCVRSGDGKFNNVGLLYDDVMFGLDRLPSVTPKQKVGHCRDCKWWKDSDGLYRRGGHAESQCPINRREVFDGNGYCYMFEPQESEGNE